jgi:hypothetical protein
LSISVVSVIATPNSLASQFNKRTYSLRMANANTGP